MLTFLDISPPFARPRGTPWGNEWHGQWLGMSFHVTKFGAVAFRKKDMAKCWPFCAITYFLDIFPPSARPRGTPWGHEWHEQKWLVMSFHVTKFGCSSLFRKKDMAKCWPFYAMLTFFWHFLTLCQTQGAPGGGGGMKSMDRSGLRCHSMCPSLVVVAYSERKIWQNLPHTVKTQCVHCRLIVSYFLFPWRNHAGMSRRSILFHN